LAQRIKRSNFGDQSVKIEIGTCLNRLCSNQNHRLRGICPVLGRDETKRSQTLHDTIAVEGTNPTGEEQNINILSGLISDTLKYSTSEFDAVYHYGESANCRLFCARRSFVSTYLLP